MSRAEAQQLRSKLNGRTRDTSRSQLGANRDQLLLRRLEAVEQECECLSRRYDSLSHSHDVLLEEIQRSCRCVTC